MSEQSESQNGYSNGHANGRGNDRGNERGNDRGNERANPHASGSTADWGQAWEEDAPHYPLSDDPGALQAASGRTLDDITLEAATQGELAPADLQIGADTLLAQAEIARRAGFRELAANLTRAAELTAVPNQELLRMYEVLRPGRSTYEELLEMAHALETTYQAHVTAEFVREAAQVYLTRDLLRRERGSRAT